MYREAAEAAGEEEEEEAGEGAVVEGVEEDAKLDQMQPVSCMDPARGYQLQEQVYREFHLVYSVHQEQRAW